MSYRVILLPLFGQEADQWAIEAALGVIQQLSDAAREEMDRQRAAARQALEAICETAGRTLVDGRNGGARQVRWLEVTGDRSETIMTQGRLSDLVVFTRPSEENESERHVIEAALLGSGRPLLLVPPEGAKSIGHAVAIAWNGSLEGARAVAGAMPFLEASITTHVLTATTRKTDPARSADLAAYLERHGVPVERHPVDPKGGSVGAALLARAVELGADLLVMGGYSRSRFREMVLGGVTHHVLGHARLPVLIAH